MLRGLLLNWLLYLYYCDTEKEIDLPFQLMLMRCISDGKGKHFLGYNLSPTKKLSD